MSIVTIIVKTFVKLLYGVIQIIGILAECIFKLSTKVNYYLVAFDNKLVKEFEKKEDEKTTDEVPE